MLFMVDSIFRPQILGFIGGVHREIATFDARAMAHVAHFVFGVGIPRCVDCVDLIRHLVDANLKADIIKQEKLCFRAHIGRVANP